MDKKKYYQEIKNAIAKDGKPHQSIITKEGIVIDGKLYSIKKKRVHPNKMIKK